MENWSYFLIIINYSQAIADFTRAIEIYPSDFRSDYNKAIACEIAKHYPEALMAYRSFRQYGPPQEIRRIEIAPKKLEGAQEKEIQGEWGKLLARFSS